MIQVKDLYKSFDDKKILEGVSFHLKEGENLGILGKSGMGKSVLTKCLVRLIEPDSGEINIMNKDVLSLRKKQLNRIRKKIGYLFQGGALYDSMSVRENLEFPVKRTNLLKTPEQLDEMVEQALRSVQLLDSIDKMPSELSGGMKKRIGLARALILNPKIIFYDEPTTGLDAVTSAEISNLILKVQEEYNASSIIVTHDMKCAEKTTNRLLILDNGTFIAEGKYSELAQSNDKKISAFFN